jgi:hypothetical protein
MAMYRSGGMAITGVREELLHLHVQDVRPLTNRSAPIGARGADMLDMFVQRHTEEAAGSWTATERP